jgi:prophage regulatory protein
MDTKPNRRLIRLRAVEAKTGLAAPSIYRGMMENWFPRSVMLGVNSRAWVEDEIDEWINQRIAARDDGSDAGSRVNRNIGRGRPKRQQPNTDERPPVAA